MGYGKPVRRARLVAPSMCNATHVEVPRQCARAERYAIRTTFAGATCYAGATFAEDDAAFASVVSASF